jgi:YVTN family beta-propeller protein
LTALEARIEADLALGRHDSLVADLETLVASHPYREDLRAQLMLALYRSGRQAEALETYRRARRTFSEELGIEPGPRLQELEGAILRHDSSLVARGTEAPRTSEEEWIETVRPERRLPKRLTLVLSAALALVIAAVLVTAARDSSGRSPVPVELAGDSVAVIDPGTDTIVGEISVGGRPTGPAVGKGSVWVGNRDDNTLLRIDPSSRKVVETIGLGLTPIDVAVGAESVWVLTNQALLRIDPAIDDVVASRRLPRLRGAHPWSHIETGENTVWICACGFFGAVVRIDSAATSVMSVLSGPVGSIAYGEGALWALAGYELDTIERIDSETNDVVETIPIGRIGEAHGYPYRMAVGIGAIWLAGLQSLWRIDPATGRFTGSVPLGHRPESVATGNGAVWLASPDGIVLRVDPESRAPAKTIPLGPLIYPAQNPAWADAEPSSIAVGEGAVWVAVTSYAS